MSTEDIRLAMLAERTQAATAAALRFRKEWVLLNCTVAKAARSMRKLLAALERFEYLAEPEPASQHHDILDEHISEQREAMVVTSN